MIKANELRIGNYVIFCNERYIVSLESFHGIKISAFPYEPILLTPEILEKAGFDNAVWQQLELPNNDEGSKETLSINGGCLFLDQEVEHGFDNNMMYQCLKNWDTKEERNNCSFVQKENKIQIPASIRYLHQLQNLYFALTGEELIINL